ncbi:MAG: pyruvate formate lyase family protein [Spirochaetales bacterium]|nr:pyruvate formate lyase family protein [Spirochaetales bacterium]
MNWQKVYSDNERAAALADSFFQEQKETTVLNGWFKVLEIHMNTPLPSGLSEEMQAALKLKSVAEHLPLTISPYAVFAGTQNDAFSSSYALIHPSFKVEEFKGYCDPLAVFSDLGPEKGMSEERIEKVKEYYAASDYVKDLKDSYKPWEKQTGEALFFVEQVTGHLIPDFSDIIRYGTSGIKEKLKNRMLSEEYAHRKDALKAMEISMDALDILAARYKSIAEKQKSAADGQREKELALMAGALSYAVENGARSLYEAVQVFILCWQTMCLEQAPNPYAFSVGNIDRLFEPYRALDGAGREASAGLFQALLAFFNVGDRSWAISQNLLLSGRDAFGTDLTNESTYAVLDAFYKGRYPQPILSMRLHKKSPEELYRATGRFFFSPGQLTPSLFNDDSMIPMLIDQGVSPEDAGNYAVAGCQEPLIMGKDNGNTTNSWLNLAKVLEVTLNGGCSTITGEKIALSPEELTGKAVSAGEVLKNIKELFYSQLDRTVESMTTAANDCSRALSHLRVPFLSTSMGGIESGIDLRDADKQGTPYNGSGCLIHGLSVLADSFQALSDFAEAKSEEECRELLEALKNDFEGRHANHERGNRRNDGARHSF